MDIQSEFKRIAELLKHLIDNKEGLSRLTGLLTDNIAKEQTLMSQITDWAAQEQADLASISTALDTVVTGIAALDALITAFQNSPGVLSASDQSALDGIQNASKALVAKSQAISVTPPVPPVVP